MNKKSINAKVNEMVLLIGQLPEMGYTTGNCLSRENQAIIQILDKDVYMPYALEDFTSTLQKTMETLPYNMKIKSTYVDRNIIIESDEYYKAFTQIFIRACVKLLNASKC